MTPRTFLPSALLALGLSLGCPVAAQDPVDEALDALARATLDAHERYRDARESLERLERGSSDWEHARRRHDTAEQVYHAHAARLDEARIQALARESGHPPGAIARMRDDGMGWGQIAKALGVHPGVLGRGHAGAAHGDGRRHDDEAGGRAQRRGPRHGSGARSAAGTSKKGKPRSRKKGEG